LPRLDARLANRFVSMYVNERTLDYGADGREASANCLIWATNAHYPIKPRWTSSIEANRAAGWPPSLEPLAHFD